MTWKDRGRLSLEPTISAARWEADLHVEAKSSDPAIELSELGPDGDRRSS
jgi:hypothetical protein